MTVAASLRDDPDHPEGGHALILLSGAEVPSGEVKVSIEPLDDTPGYRGPIQVMATPRVTNGGVELPIGPTAVDAIAPGTSVSLSVLGSNIYVETLWPTLTPLRQPTKRKPLLRTRPREVVQPASAPHARGGRLGTDGNNAPAINEDRINEERTNGGGSGEPPPLDAMLARPHRASSQEEQPSNESETPRRQDEARDQKARDEKPHEDKKTPPPAPLDKPARLAEQQPHRLNRPLAAAIALSAFILGVIVTASMWIWDPDLLDLQGGRHAIRRLCPTAIKLPSPYEILTKLANSSPAGKTISQMDPGQYLEQGKKARTLEESYFWTGWATRSLLENKQNHVGATFERTYAHPTSPVERQSDNTKQGCGYAARFAREMAAVAKDCEAMDNIAKIPPGSVADEKTADAWRERATKCKETKP